MYSFFALISRIKNIVRWALMKNSYQENVQEHSHMVAVLAHGLAVIKRDVFGGNVNPEQAATAALFHDCSEILTGDMPTPIKYYNADITAAYKQIEETANDRLISTLPEKLRPAYSKILNFENDEELKRIVKAADKLSAYIKCVEELKSGNREFKFAAVQTREKLEKLDMPEVDYFLENFMPAFELTLDELNTGRM